MGNDKITFEKFQRLASYTIESSNDVVLWIDSEGVIHYINDAVYDLLGFKPEEIIGKKAFNLNPGENLDFWRERWNILKKEKHLIFEKLQMSKEGKFIPIEASQNFIVFEGTEYSCSFLRDISDRKIAEKKLQESKEYYKSLHDNISDLIFILDVTDDKRFKFAGFNPAEEKVIGLKNEDVKGKYVDDIFPNEITDRIFKHYRKCVDEKIMIDYEENIKLSDELKHFYTRLIPLKNDKDNVSRIIGVTQDITKRKKDEKKIKEALEEVQRLKDQLQDENVYLQQEIKLSNNFDEIVTQSPKLNKVLKQVEQVSSTDATVLILGETGTGKELIARAIHNISNRGKRPLVKVNCAALHAELIESELFGHEKGAFTGAFEKKIGRFELADGGTIFLDEIGELPVDLQVKLLRVLQEGEFERLGNPKTFKVDVRVIAATNRDLKKEVEDGNFREDLYFRLNVFPLNLPPLRDRKEDIPVLVHHFVNKYAAKIGRNIKNIPQKAIDTLMSYHWPGNIRELENIIERAIIISPQSKLMIGDWFISGSDPSTKDISSMEDMERNHIVHVLEQTNWRVSGQNGAASILKINPQTLVSRMKKLGISRP